MIFKKIVAREFLFLLTTSLIIGLIYLSLTLYKRYSESKLSKLESNFTELVISRKNIINRPIDIKNRELLIKYVATANSGNYKSWEEVNIKFPEFKKLPPECITRLCRYSK